MADTDGSEPGSTRTSGSDEDGAPSSGENPGHAGKGKVPAIRRNLRISGSRERGTGGAAQHALKLLADLDSNSRKASLPAPTGKQDD